MSVLHGILRYCCSEWHWYWESLTFGFVPGTRDLVVLLALGHLDTVVTVAKKKGSTWRPPHVEIQEGFLSRIEVRNDKENCCVSGKSRKNQGIILVREKSAKNQGIDPFPWKMPLFVQFHPWVRNVFLLLLLFYCFPTSGPLGKPLLLTKNASPYMFKN